MNPAWITVCLLLTLPAPGRAGEFVVDGRHPAASDDNRGTGEQPFKTIGRAARIVEPGDTVRVRPGIYREWVQLRRSGAPGAPITFAADPPGQAVVTGADLLTGWQRVADDVPIYRVTWPHRFIIDHLPDGTPVEHHPQEAPLWGRAEQVIADGAQLLPAEDLQALRQAWDAHQAARARNQPSPALAPPVPGLGGPFAGRFSVDTTRGEMFLWLAEGSDPARCRIEAATRPAAFGLSPWENPQGLAHVRVQGFVFRYGATFPQRAAVWLQGRDNLLEDCLIEEMAGSGVNVGGVMRRCVVRGCGQTGGGAGGDSFLNQECLWEGNSWRPIDRGWDAGGFKLTGADGGVFRRCIFRRNGGPGLWLDIHVRNVLVTESVFQDNEGSGLFIEISRDITVARNLMTGNGVGMVGRLSPAAWSTAGLQIAESQNCAVVSNTCVGNKDGIALREQGPRQLETADFGTLPYHHRGHVITGNVCAFNRGYQLAFWYDNGFFGPHPAEKDLFASETAYDAHLRAHGVLVLDPARQGFVIDRNLYFAAPDEPLLLYGAEWRPRHRIFPQRAPFSALTGFDTHSQTADPRQVDPRAGDHRLAPDSPARPLEAGWLSVPADIEAWMRGFLPVWSMADDSQRRRP